MLAEGGMAMVEELVSILTLPGISVVTPRTYETVDDDESLLLKLAALQTGYVPDYSSCAVGEGSYFANLPEVTIQGDTGGIVYRDRLVIESLLHIKKCARSSGYRRKRTRRRVRKEGRYTSIFFLPEAIDNIYHWLVDCLPRLRLLNELPFDDVSLICHEGMTKYQWATLKAIAAQFRNLHTEIISADEDWILENYVFLSFGSGLNSAFLQRDCLQFLRHGLMPVVCEPALSSQRRIYVSREQAGKRRLQNEVEVRALLKQMDFETVRLERMSIADQVSCFQQASLVVGAHGAGLTNILFANDCRLIELQACDRVKPHYLLLAKACCLPYCPVLGSNADAQEDFSVDPSQLAEAVRGISQRPCRARVGPRGVVEDRPC